MDFCDTPVYLCNCRANRHTLCISRGSESLLIWGERPAGFEWVEISCSKNGPALLCALLMRTCIQLPEVVSLRTEYGVSLQKSMLESLIGCTRVWGLKLSIVKWGADPILALGTLFGPADAMSDTPRIRVVTKFSAHPRPEYQAIYPPSVFVTPKPFGHHAGITRCPSCFALHNFRASRRCAKQEGKHTHTDETHTQIQEPRHSIPQPVGVPY